MKITLRSSSRLSLIDEVQDLALHRDIELGDGLVGDQNPGLQRQRPGDDHPLSLACIEFVGIVLGRFGRQADAGEERIDPGLRFDLVADPVHEKRLDQHAADPQASIERRGRILENHLYQPCAFTGARAGEGARAGDHDVIEPDFAGHGHERAGNAIGKRRLARSALPDEREAFTPVEIQADTVDRMHPLPDTEDLVPEPALHREQHPQILDAYVDVGAAHRTGITGDTALSGAPRGLQQR